MRMHKLRRIVSKLQDEKGQWAEAARTLEVNFFLSFFLSFLLKLSSPLVFSFDQGIDIKARIEEKLSVEVCRHFSIISNLYLQVVLFSFSSLSIPFCLC